MIDEGRGGYVNIKQLSEIKSFGADSYNLTNGAITKYNFNWFTSIETRDGDILHVVLPEELSIVRGQLKCSGITGVRSDAVKCEHGTEGLKDGGTADELKIQMKGVTQSTGLYKIQVTGIQNAASLKPSSRFATIKFTTSDNKATSEYKKDVSIRNVFASNLLGLTSDNIKQESWEYSKANDYVIKFKPTSKTKKYYRNILLSYPVTVGVEGDGSQTRCSVTAGSNRAEGTACKKVEGARLFKITKAIPPDYDGDVEVKIRLVNPEDNWGRVGVKIKTYVDDGSKEYLSDILEGNQLIPILKCTAPCKECKDGGRDGSGGKVDKNYCTECWQKYPQKYLQTTVPWDDGKGTGQSTCQVNCDRGYSSNGTVP